MDTKYADAIAKYGREFGSPYGWAGKHLNMSKPTFRDIQDGAGRGGMNSHYKMASFNIHAGARSMFFRFTSLGGSDLLLAGRSNAGLVEPGNNAAYSLVQITGLVVGDTINPSLLIELHAVMKIRDAIPPSLARADRKLRREEKAFRRTQAKSQTRNQ